MQGGLRWMVWAVVVAAGVGFWVLLDDSGAAVDEGATASLTDRSAEESGVPVSLPEPNVPARAEAEPTRFTPEAGLAAGELESPVSAVAEVATPLATLRGRVLDPGGRPVPEARVVYQAPTSLLRGMGGGLVNALPQDPETLTDVEGRFELAVPLPDDSDAEEDLGLRMLGAVRNLVVDRAPYAVLVHETPPLGADGHDLGDLHLALGGSLSGVVLDEAGRPVVGAAVTPRRELTSNASVSIISVLGQSSATSFTTVNTDLSGRFVVQQLDAAEYSLDVMADGMQAGASLAVEIEPGTTKDVGVITLKAGAAIAGYVVDARGAPIEGANVRVSSMSRIVLSDFEDAPSQLGREWQLRATTDAAGHFRLAGLGAGQYTVHARGEGYAPGDVPNVNTGTHDVRLVLDRLGGVFVRLRSARDETPVDGATLQFSPVPTGGMMEMSSNDAEFLTGAEALAAAGREGESLEGAYFVQGVGPNGLLAEVLAEGFATEEFELPGLLDGGVTSMEVELDPAAVLRGVVLSADGDPQPDALVTISEWTPPANPSGGTFFEARDIEMRLGDEDRADWRKTHTDDSGRFELGGLPAGDWELVASAERAADSEPLVLSTKLGEAKAGVVLHLSAAGSIRGRVIEESGAPVADMGVSLKFVPAGGGFGGSTEDALRQAMLSQLGLGGQSESVTTDANGDFLAEGLAVGRWEAALQSSAATMMGGGAMIVLDSLGGPSDEATKQLVDVVADEESWVEIIKPRHATLTGRVLAGGEPVPGARVKLEKAGGGFFSLGGGMSAEAGSDGRFRFDEVAAGDYELSALVPGAAMRKSVDLQLESGREESADLVFDGETLRGKLVDATSGDGVAGALITVAPHRDSGAGGAPAFGSFQVVTSFSDGGGGGGMSMTLGGGSSSSVHTDADGSFEVRFLEPGTYKVESEGGGYAAGELGPVEIESGRRPDEVRIEVSRAARVFGTVIDGKTGQPMAGVPVSLGASGSGGGGFGGNMVMTGDDGSYELSDLDAGSWVVSVLGSGFSGGPLASETVQLKPGEEQRVDLTTEP